MTVIYDPLSAVLKATKSIYPKTEAVIKYFASPEFKEGVDRIEDSRFSSITFPKDGDIPEIIISGNVPFKIMIELLCRQLTNAIVGLPNEDNEESWNDDWDKRWFQVHSNILHEYSSKAVK